MSSLLFFIITLAILVTIHEYGHFWVARRCGVKVLTFSVGFGKPLWRRTDRHGTEFVVAAIPLGGYVRMVDEREGEVADDDKPRAFNRQPLGARAAIVSAGPLANFLLAIAVYWLVFILGVPGVVPLIGDIEADSAAYHAGFERGQAIVAVDGKPTPSRASVHLQLIKRVGDTGTIDVDLRYPDGQFTYQVSLPVERWLAGDDMPNPYSSLGFRFYSPDLPALLDRVVDDGPAAAAGLQAGDQIVGIDGVVIDDWQQLIEQVQPNAGKTITLTVLRDGQTFDVALVVGAHRLEGGSDIGRIGVQVHVPELPESMRVLEKRTVVDALLKSVDQTGEMITLTLVSIKKMLVGLISTSSLSGPVAIAKMASASADSGFIQYMQFLALLSVSLGVLNLLPIPILDGGHLLFIVAEAIIRRPVPERLQIIGQQLGLFLILGVMALALYNDFTHF